MSDSLAQMLLVSAPAAPLLVAIFILIFGKRFENATGWLCTAGSGWALAALMVLGGRELSPTVVWARSGGFELTVGLNSNPLSYLTAVLVAFVSTVVAVYAVPYMAEEQDKGRFFTGFSFFIGAMLALVLASSFVLLFAAWEGVGLASFLLIGFWYQEEAARSAAGKAFVITRLGDIGLFLGWLLAWQSTGSTEIAVLLKTATTPGASGGALNLMALLFFAGAIGKSAQLPLTAWLPAAMAGPTPVSALIHSATMVAAGVYLILRLFPLFAAAPLALETVLWVGAATALFAGLVATVQNDLKRLLAWSTVSQLGEMMMALGLAGPLAAAFHLAAHASFKSTLFLTAGAVDHAAGSRDLRNLGRLAKKLPWIAAAFGFSALALAGAPPFSGFWSEEAILGAAAKSPAFAGRMVALIFLAGIYISRGWTAVFGDWPGAPASEVHPLTGLLRAATVFMAFVAAILGWLLSGRLAAWLPFTPSPEAGLSWRFAAVAAGLAGIGLGIFRVRATGPAPALGGWPTWLEKSMEAWTRIPASGAFLAARGLAQVEKGLDSLARGLAGWTWGAARLAEKMETGFEQGAQGVGQSTMLSAQAVEASESQAFGEGLDDFAGLFSRSGGRLRRLQSGKIYLYTLALFLWVLVAGGLSALIFVLR